MYRAWEQLGQCPNEVHSFYFSPIVGFEFRFAFTLDLLLQTGLRASTVMLNRPQQLVVHDQWTWNIEKDNHKYYHHCAQFGKCARLFPFKYYIMSIGMCESQQHWLVHETWWFIASHTSCTYWQCWITILIWMKTEWIC